MSDISYSRYIVFKNISTLLNDPNFDNELRKLFSRMAKESGPRTDEVFLKLKRDHPIYEEFVKNLANIKIFNVPIENIRVEIAKFFKKEHEVPHIQIKGDTIIIGEIKKKTDLKNVNIRKLIDEEYLIWEGGSDLSILSKAKNLFENKKLNLVVDYKELTNMDFEYNNIITFNTHDGQRKLLLTEIQFLTDYYNKQIVVYAGSAPNEKLPILLKLFPTMKILLIDPNYHRFDYSYKYFYFNYNSVDKRNLNITKRHIYSNKHSSRTLKNAKFFNGEKHNLLEEEFDNQSTFLDFIKDKNLGEYIKNNKDRVYIIQDYLTESLCLSLKRSFDLGGRTNLLFISDIRTNIIASYPTDIDFLWNDALQMIHIKTLQPDFSMIKFHPPYHNELLTPRALPDYINEDFEKVDVDFLSNYKKDKHIYFKADAIYLQAWARVSSAEARLIVSKDNINKLVNYDYKEWETKYQYIKYLRSYGCHDIPLVDGYDRSFDCALELYILQRYIKKYGGTINNLKKIIDKNQPLNHKAYIFEPLNHINMYRRDKDEYINIVTKQRTDNPIPATSVKDLFKK